MADTWIAVAIAALTLITAYVGVHITMHPAETVRAKTTYKVAFGVCAVATCVLIGIQTHRNGKAQTTLLNELKRVELHALMPSDAQCRPQPAEAVPPALLPKEALHSTVKHHQRPKADSASEPTLEATKQLQQQTPNGEWVTTFTVSSDVIVQTGDLRLMCDGPVLRAGISRINPASFSSGSNGPSPSNPNEAIYELSQETLSPGVVVVIAVYSQNPVHVLSGSLGNQVIKIAK